MYYVLGVRICGHVECLLIWRWTALLHSRLVCSKRKSLNSSVQRRRGFRRLQTRCRERRDRCREIQQRRDRCRRLSVECVRVEESKPMP